MKRYFSTVAGAIAIFAGTVATSAWAQEGISSLPAPTSCAIHIWPAEGLDSHGEGFVWNHVEGQALRGLTDRALLTPVRQVALLRNSAALIFWGTPEKQIIIHDGPPVRRPVGTAPTRRSPNDGACVREIVIQKVLFVYSGLGDKNLRAMVALEDYGEGPAPVRRYTTWGDASLPNFPPKKPEENEQAIQQLEQSFGLAWSSFTARALKELEKPATTKKSPLARSEKLR